MDVNKIKLESTKQIIINSFPDIKDLNVYWKGDQIKWDFKEDEIHTRRAVLSCVANFFLSQAVAEWNKEHAEDCLPGTGVKIGGATFGYKDDPR